MSRRTNKNNRRKRASSRRISNKEGRLYRFQYPDAVVLMDLADPTKRMTKEIQVIANGSLRSLPTEDARDPVTLLALWNDATIKDPRLVEGSEAGKPGDAIKSGLMILAIQNALRAADEARKQTVPLDDERRTVALENDHFERYKKALLSPQNPYDPRVVGQLLPLFRAVDGAMDDVQWKEAQAKKSAEVAV